MWAKGLLDRDHLLIVSSAPIVLKVEPVVDPDTWILYEVAPTRIESNLLVYEYVSRELYYILRAAKLVTRIPESPIPITIVSGSRILLSEPWNSLLFIYRAANTVKEIEVGKVVNVLALCTMPTEESKIYCHPMPEIDVARIVFGGYEWRYTVSQSKFVIPRAEIREFVVKRIGSAIFGVVGRATKTRQRGIRIALFDIERRSIRLQIPQSQRR